MDPKVPQSAALEAYFQPLTIASSPTTFPLTKLPVELQLRVLEACLTRPQPLVDIFRSRIPQRKPYQVWSMSNAYGDADEEKEGSMDNKPYLNILFTSRFFWDEGREILFTKNRFMLTAHGVYPIEIPTALPERLYFAQLRHLIFLHHNAWPPNESMLCTISHACKAALRLQGLETLKIDFVAMPLDYDEGRLVDAYELGVKNAQFFARVFSGPPNPYSKLQKIRITGLFRSHFALVLVQALNNVLSPGGLIGVGFGTEGSRYERVLFKHVSPELILRPNPRMKLHWMARDEVEEWVSSTKMPVSMDNDLTWILLSGRDGFESESE